MCITLFLVPFFADTIQTDWISFMDYMWGYLGVWGQ